MPAGTLAEAPFPWLSALLTPVSAWALRFPTLAAPHDLWVPPDPPPGDRMSAFDEIRAELEADPRQKVLLTSQRGAGKSQLVNELEHQLRSTGRCEPVYISLTGQDGTDPGDTDIVDILFFVARALAALAAGQDPVDRPLDLDEPSMASLNELNQLLVARYHLQGVGPARVGKDAAAWYARFEDWLRQDPNVRGDVRKLVRARHVLALVQDLLRKAEGPKKLPFVLLLDDTDKLQPDDARRLFVDNARELALLRCGMVATYPSGLSFDGGVQGARTLLNVSVVHRQTPDAVRPEAVSWFRRMLAKLMDPELIAPDALERVVWLSGGVPAELGRLLRPAVMLATQRGGTRVELGDLAISEARRMTDLTRLSQSEERRDLLARVHRTGELPGDDARRLLDLHLVFEYNNEENPRIWYDVHPLLRPHVGRRQGKTPK